MSEPTISDAILIAARAGKLRAHVRTFKPYSGASHTGVEGLADHESARVTAILNRLFPPDPTGENAW